MNFSFSGSSDKKRVTLRGSSQTTTSREDLIRRAREERERHQVHRQQQSSATLIQKWWRRNWCKLQFKRQQAQLFDQSLRGAKLNSETCEKLMQLFIASFEFHRYSRNEAIAISSGSNSSDQKMNDKDNNTNHNEKNNEKVEKIVENSGEEEEVNDRKRRKTTTMMTSLSSLSSKHHVPTFRNSNEMFQHLSQNDKQWSRLLILSKLLLRNHSSLSLPSSVSSSSSSNQNVFMYQIHNDSYARSYSSSGSTTNSGNVSGHHATSFQVKRYLRACLYMIQYCLSSYSYHPATSDEGNHGTSSRSSSISGSDDGGQYDGQYDDRESSIFNNVHILLLVQAVTTFLDPSLYDVSSSSSSSKSTVHTDVCTSVQSLLFPILRQLLVFSMRNDNERLINLACLLLERVLLSGSVHGGTYFCYYILSIPHVIDRVRSISKFLSLSSSSSSSTVSLIQSRAKLLEIDETLMKKLMMEENNEQQETQDKVVFLLYMIGNIVSLLGPHLHQVAATFFRTMNTILMTKTSSDEHHHGGEEKLSIQDYLQHNELLVTTQLKDEISKLFDRLKNVELRGTLDYLHDMCSVLSTLIGNEERRVDVINNLVYRTDFISSCWRYLMERRQLWSNSSVITNTTNSSESRSIVVQVLYMFATCYHSLLIIQDDEEFVMKETPLSKKELALLATQLKTIVFDMYWSGCSLEQRPLRKTLEQLLTHIHNRNSKTRFCAEECFLMPSTINIDFSSLTAQYADEDDERNGFGGEPMEIDDAFASISRLPLSVQRRQALRSAMMEPRSVTTPTTAATDEQRIWRILQEIPYVIPFTKRVKILHDFIEQDRETYGMNWMAPVTVRRNFIFEDGFTKLYHLGYELKNDIRVQFESEDGHLEAGIGQGVFKEFIIQLSQVAFSANYGLFLSTSDGDTIYPNPNSALLYDDDTRQFRFLGLIIGKALYEKILVDVPFARFFVSKLLGKTNYLNDLKSLDKELHKNLMFLKNYSGNAEDLSLNFTVTVDEYGQSRTINLIKDGANTPVTNQNKHLYIHRMAYYKLNTQIKRQSEAFLGGLSMIINKSWLKMFNEFELYKLICGNEETAGVFSVSDMRRHTVYGEPFHDGHPTIQLFWQVVESMNATQKRQLLKFITSSPRPPLLGFQDLDQKIAIRPTPSNEGLGRLPTSSTCVNLLKLPMYQDLRTMRDKLLKAIENTEGFELT